MSTSPEPNGGQGGGCVLIGSPRSLLGLPPPGHKYVVRNHHELKREATPKLCKRNPNAARWLVKESTPEYSWTSEVSWRIRTRFSAGDGDGDKERIEQEIQRLMPDEEPESQDTPKSLGQIRAIALPSILESLQGGTGLIGGIPKEDMADRHVLLAWQYRMHPDIASFSHKHVYGGKALSTPDSMAPSRSWRYGRYGHRAVWIDVRGREGKNNKSYSNDGEAAQVIREVKAFCDYAGTDPKPDGAPWTVAVLSFYTGQIAVLQEQMRRLTGQTSRNHFKIPVGKTAVHIDTHTVDRFQGHEADVVFLSTVRNRPTIFLNHINRINVAVTRARYQCVIIGNRKAMGKNGDTPLGYLVSEIPAHGGKESHG